MQASVWQPPYAPSRGFCIDYTPGETIGQIINRVDLPAGFGQRGLVTIDGHIVERQYWSKVKPKEGTVILCHMTLQGDAGRQVLGIVAAIALSFATAGIAGGALATSGGLFTAGSVSAKILAGSVGLIGSLAISALTRPPTPTQAARQTEDQARGAAGAESNAVEPGAPFPRVVGTAKVFPRLATLTPIVDLVGKDEVVEAIYALGGPHKLEDIRIGDGKIADAQDVQLETREGWADDAPLTLITRYGYQAQPGLELSRHKVKDESQFELVDQAAPSNSLPYYHDMTSRAASDEVWLHLNWPEGFIDTASSTAVQRVAFRPRIRALGNNTWIDLPEIHYAEVGARQFRAAIKLKWEVMPDNLPTTIPTKGWVAAYSSVSGQYDADSHFYAGSGTTSLYNGGQAASGVNNVFLEAETCTFYLDEATFPKGIYEISLKRSHVFPSASFSNSGYTLSGVVRDLFGFYLSSGVARIAVDRANKNDKVILSRLQTIINATPVEPGNFALIAVKGTNRGIEQLNVIASGYVKDWDGSGWNTWTTTSNPAPHYYDTLAGLNNPDPSKPVGIDSAGLVAWRADCATNGYECNAAFVSSSIADVQETLASCGYAQPYMSEVYGVIQDKDRSSELPLITFGPRDTKGFTISKAFQDLPDGLRVVFQDEDNLYRSKEQIVYRNESGTVFERVEYIGITDRAKAIARAEFDLAQATLRATEYSFTAPDTALFLRRGDLIGYSHDVIDKTMFCARLLNVIRNQDGLITDIVLDGNVEASYNQNLSDITNLSAQTELSKIGFRSGIVLPRNSTSAPYTSALAVNAVNGNRLTLLSPLDDDNILSCAIATVGRVQQEYKRLIVTRMSYKPWAYECDITAVDEAPELWS